MALTITTLKTGIKSILVLTMIILGAYTVSHAQSPQLANQYISEAQAAQKSGRYLEAARLYEKSAEAEQSSRNPRLYALAAELNNAAFCYSTIGQYDKAIKYYEESLVIVRKLGKESDVAILLNNIGDVYGSWGQYDKAIKYYEESLSIERKLGREGEVATSLNNIGYVYKSWGQYDKAIKYYEESLVIVRKLGKKDEVAAVLNNIGAVYSSLNQYNKAIDSFSASLTLKENLRKTATGVARRDYLASQIDTYRFLISAYLRNNDLPNAFSAMEISRAKLLAERLAGSDSMPAVPTIRSIQQEMPADAAIISFANTNSDNPAALVITKYNMAGAELDKKKFLDSIRDTYKRPIEQVLAQQRGLKVIGKSTERDQKPQNESATSFDDIVNYYRSLLTDASSGINRSGRGLVVAGKPGDPGSTARLDRLLYDFLIQPIAKSIKGKKHLIIIPDGVLSYLPFETLIDESNNYLVEKYAISYVQSMGVMEMLKKRTYPAGQKSMLAFGGAVYDEVSYTGGMITNEQQLLALAKNVYATIRSRGSLGTAYAALGIKKWDNLPGTLSEVAAIAKTVKGAKVVTGRNVTESTVKQLSASGELSKYKVIHFATHGIVVPEIPELSAIVLSQLKNQPAGEDGYLRMDKIEALRMKADFVNLSARETGRGKIFGGEGVVGLTQSFLLAGANGLSASLWSVNDVSTSQFMVALYSMVEQKKIGYGDAIAEIKRGFIQGKFGETYKAPYYWAPFVYYGYNSGSLRNPVKEVAMGLRPPVAGKSEGSSALKLQPKRSNSADTANKLKRNDQFITTGNGTVEKKPLKIEDDRERLATKQESERKNTKKDMTSAVGARPSVTIANEIRRDSRFIAYDNGTVLDTKTNLMWAVEDNRTDINWAKAKSYCENYRGGGYTDWRMPTQDELAELYDASSTGYALDCGSQYGKVKLTNFIRLSCCCPWASETRDSDAAYFSFNYGLRYWYHQSYVSLGRALPVRSGK